MSTVRDVPSIVGSLAAFASTLIAALFRKIGFTLRLTALLAAITLVAAGVILHNGYMSPVALAAISVTPLLAALFAAPWAIVATLATNALVFLCGAHGPISTHWNDGNVDPTVARNWFRIALVFPVAYSFAARLVLDIFEVGIATVKGLERSLQALILARDELVAETQSLATAQLVAERATRLEAASRVAGTIAHDLNNALGAILGWATLLLESEIPSPEDTRTAVTAFGESAQLAETLVSQLDPRLRSTRSTEVVTDMAQVCGSFIKVLEHSGRQDIRIELCLTDGCYAPIDGHDLRRILMNLVANARDAMPAGGTITVSCFANEQTNETCLRIADSGIGMNEPTLAHLFDAFFTTKAQGRGTGLGLHAVREIVRASGGSIQVQSELNRGSCFTITWPLSKQPSVLAGLLTSVVASQSGSILLVEDDPFVRSALARGLTRAGYHVTQAANGDQARALLDEHKDWDVLCSDAVIPGYPSAQLIKDFQTLCPGRRVVVCSGYLPSDIEEAIPTKGVVLLHKPFPTSALVEALQR
jgi:signal transduction histidine kinase/CheY-like chemotaxis protein